METPFSNKCKILGEFWISYKDDEAFGDFFKYNDLGLPIAYFVWQDLVVGVSEEATRFIEETWDMFAMSLELDDDVEWTDLLQVFEAKFPEQE